jgi:hypothetical protein
MPLCGKCGIFVNNIGKHVMRGRCKLQHIRKKIRKIVKRRILYDEKNGRGETQLQTEIPSIGDHLRKAGETRETI